MSTLPSMAPRGPKPHRQHCFGKAYCGPCEAWTAGWFDGPPRHRAPKHAQIYLVSRDLRPRVTDRPRHRADVAAESGAA